MGGIRGGTMGHEGAMGRGMTMADKGDRDPGDRGGVPGDKEGSQVTGKGPR